MDQAVDEAEYKEAEQKLIGLWDRDADGCEVKQSCGGFFSSAKIKYSNNIRPILASNTS
jgi:hypothetical protein